VFAGHQVGELEVEVDADRLGGEQDGAAGRAAGNVVEVDGHFWFGTATEKPLVSHVELRQVGNRLRRSHCSDRRRRVTSTLWINFLDLFFVYLHCAEGGEGKGITARTLA
jgi:hypothetical protein